MDDIATIERPRQEVLAPPAPAARTRRSGSTVVLGVIAAAVLAVSALGAVVSSPTYAAALLANGSATAAPGSVGQAGSPAPTPAGGRSAVPGAGAAQAGPQAGAQHTVNIKDLKFTPQALTVNTGDTVTWVNGDTVPHTVTVTSGPEKFDSQTIQPGAKFSHTFTKPGMYSYYCAVHPDMTASVMVGGAAPAPPASPAVPPGDAAPMPPPGGDAGAMPPADAGGQCGGPSAALAAAWQHVKSAHLQESPGQQVTDLLSLDQYVKTHTVLVQHMLDPLVGGLLGGDSSTSADVLWQHVKSAHLQESPGQQVTDLLSLDQYTKTHTVLAQNALSPELDSATC